MRKEGFFFVGTLVCMTLLLGGCKVRHDHSKQMQQMRVPVDTAQKGYVDEERARAAEAEAELEEEGIFVMPEEPVRGSGTTNIDEEIERMMSGEDVYGE